MKTKKFKDNKDNPKSLFSNNNDKLNIFVVKTSLKSILKDYNSNFIIIDINIIIINTFYINNKV